MLPTLVHRLTICHLILRRYPRLSHSLHGDRATAGLGGPARRALAADLPLDFFVFAGDADRSLKAFDAETGKTLAVMQASELGCIRTGAAILSRVARLKL